MCYFDHSPFTHHTHFVDKRLSEYSRCPEILIGQTHNRSRFLSVDCTYRIKKKKEEETTEVHVMSIIIENFCYTFRLNSVFLLNLSNKKLVRCIIYSRRAAATAIASASIQYLSRREKKKG